VLVSLLALSFSASAADEVKLASKPAATKSGDKTTISFSVSAPTDVEVSVLDASGKVVRHLVAGVLGGKLAPPEPLKPGLSQSIEWDGKDDTGKTAAGGPFKARIAAGMKPQFDGFLMHNPEFTGHINAIATGPGGSLYVFHQDGTANSNMGGIKLKVYDRQAHYQRVLMPYPADIAPEKAKAGGVFRTAEGDLNPRVYNYETMGLYPDSIGVRGRDFLPLSSPVVDANGRVYWMVKGPAICAVDGDGGLPYEKFIGPKLLTDQKLDGQVSYYYWHDGASLALSTDGKWLYFAGLGTGQSADLKAYKLLPCVFRVSTATRGPAEVFLGDLKEAGSGKDRLTAPRGLAVAKGMIYVADTSANRVVCYKEADHSYVGEFKVTNPQSIGIDAASGALYVCSYTGPQTATLIKFSSGDSSARELCHLDLPKTGLSPNYGEHRIAVDASTKPVLIWMPELAYGGKLFCIEDAGDKLVNKGDPRNLKELAAEGPRDLSVDRVHDELYVKANGQNYYRFDATTGKLKDTIDLAKIPNNCNSTQLVVGSDGDLYTDTWGTGLWRLNRSGKELNWEGQGTHIIPMGGVMCFQERHLALKPFAPVDEFYLVPWTPNSKMTALNVYGQDGKPRRTVVWQTMTGAIPRVDAKGNIYIADLVKPPDHSYPEFFDGKLPPPPDNCGTGDDKEIESGAYSLYWNSYMYGSIIKFPPSGGIIWFDKNLYKDVVITPPPSELLAQKKVPFKRHFAYSPNLTGELQGALWYRFGFAPYSAHMSGMTSHCMCEGAGFEVDPYGRVFFPNCGQFRVEVVDTNNNAITTFGKYGNEDSGGPNAKIKKPDIPLAWPCYVAVSDTHAYVADSINRRVARVKLSYAAEATCSLP
jgi:outer membrane protein assembly factor BamB